MHDRAFLRAFAADRFAQSFGDPAGEVGRGEKLHRDFNAPPLRANPPIHVTRFEFASPAVRVSSFLPWHTAPCDCFEHRSGDAFPADFEVSLARRIVGFDDQAALFRDRWP
jgi:hypothetical protein